MPTDPMEISTKNEIESLLKAAQSDDIKNYQKILITQDIFKKIKEDLLTTIKSIEKNPSMLSRLAKFWGPLPLWQKILGGAALTVPFLILGIVANLGFLLAICGVTTIVYTGVGIVLDDHHHCSVSITESLNEGILSLADLLELTITALDIVRQKLAEEVDKFTEENEQLRQNIAALAFQIDLLGHEIAEAKKMTKSLRLTKDALEQTAKNLENKIDVQGKLLDATLLRLDEKTAEFTKIKTDLELEILKVQAVASVIEASSTNLSKIVLDSKEQQQEYKEKLDAFLTDKSASFDKVGVRLKESEAKLALTQETLHRTSEHYKSLNEEQACLIEQLKTIIKEFMAQPQTPKPLKEHSSSGLDKIGIFSPASRLQTTNDHKPLKQPASPDVQPSVDTTSAHEEIAARL